MSAQSLAAPLTKRWEGFAKIVQLRPILMAGPYLCPAVVPTIGYGTVVQSLAHPAITQGEAEILLTSALVNFELSTLRMCPILAHAPENKLAAVVSFVYNLGPGRLKASTLRELINRAEWTLAANEFQKWVWAGGRKLPGLIGRRADEAALFLRE